MQIEPTNVPVVKKKMFSFKGDEVNGNELAIKQDWRVKIGRVHRIKKVLAANRKFIF